MPLPRASTGTQRGNTWRKENTKQAVCSRPCLMGLHRGSAQGILKKSSFALLFFPLSQCEMLVWTLGSSLLSVFPKIVSERSWEHAPVRNPGQGGCWGGFSLEAVPGSCSLCFSHTEAEEMEFYSCLEY